MTDRELIERLRERPYRLLNFNRDTSQAADMLEHLSTQPQPDAAVAVERPIETAPKDRKIMLFANGTWFAECQWQEAGAISEHGFWQFWHMVEGEFFSEVIDPTAWAELPAAIRAGGQP